MDDKSVGARNVVENQYVSIIGEELNVKNAEEVSSANTGVGSQDAKNVLEAQYVSTERERSTAKIVEGVLFATMEN